MKIVSTQYSLPYKSLDIYVSGCCGSCYNCHNPEIKDFEIGTNYEEILPKIIEKIEKFDLLIENVWIMGGEPLDQNLEHLLYLLIELYTETNKDIWLWTRHNLKDIPRDIQLFTDYIKCGEFIEELWTEDNIQYGIKLMTSNQIIYKRGVDY